MCGIAGYVGRAEPALLPGMLARLRHRGPDECGMHTEARAGLGTARLAIIDLATGHQPMANEDGSLWLAFNGEIYNFRALRAELEAAGHRFQTRSDTEVILHAYERFGEACVDRLRGMFAFAVWDARRRTLFLARDRLGKKPLYYWRGDGLVLFASELKALLAHPGVDRALDWPALHEYLAFGYTPSSRSIMAGIEKLPPAHVATLRDGALALRRYWMPPAPAAASGRVDARDVAAHVREVVRDAVRARLESDVPLGLFLSGGVDSSIVLASMREVTSGPIHTFSIGFGRTDPSYDELPYARLVARRFESDHHEEIVEPHVAEVLPTIVRHLDEPLGDSSTVPTFVVAQATARHVKAALSGLGGDETFAGYPRYLGVRVADRWRRLPRWVRDPIAAVFRRVPPSERSPDWGDRIRRFVTAADHPALERYVEWTRFFSDDALAALATPPLREAWASGVDGEHRAELMRRAYPDAVDGAFRLDLGTYLPDDLLVIADRLSMAHSLEVRTPFCDHLVVEESLRIPPALKLRRGRLKALLKAAYADVLPPAVLGRGKRGFMIPLGRWLRGELRPLMNDLLAPAQVAARGLFSPAAVQALREQHVDGRDAHADRLWTLMVLELWMREYLDGPTTWSVR